MFFRVAAFESWGFSRPLSSGDQWNTLLLTPGTYSSYVTAHLSAKLQRWRRPVSSGSRPAENDVLLCPGMNAAAVLTSKLLSF
jgi:hypothetical protein